MQRNGHKKLEGSEPNNTFTQMNKVFTTLVIESKDAYAGILEDFLKKEGYFVLRAISAEDAMAMTTKHWPDLILLNKEMPGSNGIKFLPELLIEHPSAAIIMMANKANANDAVEAMKLGAVDYLERPLDLVRLKELIDIQKEFHRLL